MVKWIKDAYVKYKENLVFSVTFKENKTEKKLEWILNMQMLCKDSWKYGLQRSSADQKIYLFKLQQGLSSEVLLAMKKKGIILVVPKSYIECYPMDKTYEIWSIEQYITYMESMDGEI